MQQEFGGGNHHTNLRGMNLQNLLCVSCITELRWAYSKMNYLWETALIHSLTI